MIDVGSDATLFEGREAGCESPTVRNGLRSAGKILGQRGVFATDRCPLISLMSLASTTRNVFAAMLLAISAGCFTEPAESETGSPTCDQGSFGCECLGGVCEPDLVCTPTNVCIPEDCTPGTAICECDAQGQCGAMLECVGNVCFPPGGTTVGSETEGTSLSDTSTTSGTNTTSTATTDPDDTGTTEAVDSSTTEDPTNSDTSSSTSTGDPADCNDAERPGELPCAECFECTHESDCEVQSSDCGSVPGCVTVASCMQTCAISGLCPNCCGGHSQEAIDAAVALQTCRQDACIGNSCESYATYLCEG